MWEVVWRFATGKFPFPEPGSCSCWLIVRVGRSVTTRAMRAGYVPCLWRVWGSELPEAMLIDY